MSATSVIGESATGRGCWRTPCHSDLLDVLAEVDEQVVQPRDGGGDEEFAVGGHPMNPPVPM